MFIKLIKNYNHQKNGQFLINSKISNSSNMTPSEKIMNSIIRTTNMYNKKIGNIIKYLINFSSTLK